MNPYAKSRTSPSTGGGIDQDPGVWARYANLVIAIWLFISAFIWPHADASRTNTWILAVIIGVVSVWAIWTPTIRWINMAAAVWLFFSTLAIPHYVVGTVWNNVIVSIAVFLLSMVPNRGTHMTART